VALRDAFLAPYRITDEGGIDPILRGLASQPAQDVDPYVVDDVRNFLFGPPGAGGFDLASLNIQRGRDHGLPSYNRMRIDLGLAPAADFGEITSDPAIRASLESVYDDVDDVDLWPGALAEDHVPSAMVGELLRTIITDQFTRLRDGDRYWYERIFTGPVRARLDTVRLADIIRANTGIGDEIANDVFHLAVSCTGDLDGDGTVGIGDLIALLGAWGASDDPADLDGNGSVGLLDLLILFGHWGPCG
jgi:hypothetical protein